MRVTKDVKLTLGAGIMLLAAVGALTLTGAPPRVVRVGAKTISAEPPFLGSMSVCQQGEVLPAGVSAIRLAVGAFYGSPIRVQAFSGSRILAEGERGADWTGRSVTVPVAPLNRSVSQVKLCFTLGPSSELAFIAGSRSPRSQTAVNGFGESLGGKVGVEYLASGRGSWWSRIGTLARNLGIGHALSGSWVALLVAALMATVGVLAVRVTLRELP